MEKETIINRYDGTRLNMFKGEWKRRYRQVASNLNFFVKNNSDDSDNWQALVVNELKVRKKTPSSSPTTTITRRSATKSTKFSHNNLISADEKESAISYLENLPVEEKWKLKTGRLVEDVIMQAINDSHYEHPCLSFILDLADPLWVSYFSVGEINEVRAFNSVPLPVLENETQKYIDLYDNDTLKTAGDYYEFSSNQKLKLNDACDKR
jgi:hypothetical protein